jgi:Cu+-exporting ATPase
VSGDEFEVTAKSPKVEHEGKTYYFCCGGCDKKFQADPAKYLTGK